MNENPLINRVAIVRKTRDTGIVCDVCPAPLAERAGNVARTSTSRWVLLLLMTDGSLEVYRHDEVKIG